MTLAEIRQRIEKGCERQTFDDDGDEICCGDVPDDHQIYCPRCQAQLKLLSEIEGEMNKAIDFWSMKHHLMVLGYEAIDELRQKLLGVGTNSQSTEKEVKQ